MLKSEGHKLEVLYRVYGLPASVRAMGLVGGKMKEEE